MSLGTLVVVGLIVVTLFSDTIHDDLQIEGQDDSTRFLVIGSRFGQRIFGLAETQLVQSIAGSSLKRKSTSSVHAMTLLDVVGTIEGSSLLSSSDVGGVVGPLLLKLILLDGAGVGDTVSNGELLGTTEEGDNEDHNPDGFSD